jgi:hypothetical protein
MLDVASVLRHQPMTGPTHAEYQTAGRVGRRPVRPERAGPWPLGAPLLQHLQRTCGNQAVLRHLAVQRDDGSGSGAPRVVTPNRKWVLPFDRTPLSSPGETVLFNAVFDGAVDSQFQFLFTGVGGKFDSASGAAAKTVPGLDSGNVPFVIDAAWDGRSPVTVKLELRRVADGSLVDSWNWTFGKKTRLPTTITQEQPESELPLGATYDYKLGPDRGGKPNFGHETILETFQDPTCNITLADVTDAWKKQNPGVTKDTQLPGWFSSGTGANGTFVVDADDKIHDQHDGGLQDKAFFESKLKKMKEIYFDTVQTYSVKPGTALGTYNVRRILKTDGSKMVKKTKI